MCRNIKPLFHFDPPATPEEIELAARQYAHKVCGFTKPSKINEAAFETAIMDIAAATEQLFSQLQSTAPFKDRAVESEKAKARSLKRFG